MKCDTSVAAQLHCTCSEQGTLQLQHLVGHLGGLVSDRSKGAQPQRRHANGQAARHRGGGGGGGDG